MRDGSGTRRALGLAVLLALGSGCGPPATTTGNGGDPPAMARQLAADLARIGKARIYFHHHSVGVNIIAGVERLEAETGGGHLLLAGRESAASIEGPVLAHGGDGQNGAPKTKIDSFAAILRSEPRLRPDVAFMKLCFVDFSPQTDVDDLFATYRRTLESLKLEHPGIRFAHATVPLFERPTDLKARLQRLLGRAVWEDEANVKRAEYNSRLRDAFASDPIFDLARVEATRPDGSEVAFELRGRTYPSLYSGYTDDGGHLNALGQRAAGAAAVQFLAEALAADRQAR